MVNVWASGQTLTCPKCGEDHDAMLNPLVPCEAKPFTNHCLDCQIGCCRTLCPTCSERLRLGEACEWCPAFTVEWGI